MARLVSVVGGDDLGIELNLAAVCEDIDAEIKKYEPESYPALYLRFTEDGATIMLFSSGKYNIAGADSIEDLYQTHRQLAEEISNLLDSPIDIDEECDLRNLVYVDDYGESIDFAPLIAVLGLNNIEYEPESFPSLDYRPPNYSGLFKIFSSGKLSLTGVTDPDGVDGAFEHLKQNIRKSQSVV